MIIRSLAHPLMLLMLTAVSSGPVNAQNVPFAGIIVPNNVQVRAGAGRAYYIVGNLHKGDIVQVNDVIFGWDKIVSPPEIYSYVSKAFVDAKGDGKVGVVNNDRTLVKAGSVQGPGESYKPQATLDKGDQVEILGAEGDYYKIKPPKGAYVFLPPGSVRRATPAQVADYKARIAAASKVLDHNPPPQLEQTANPAAATTQAAAESSTQAAEATSRSESSGKPVAQTTAATAKPSESAANPDAQASAATTETTSTAATTANADAESDIAQPQQADQAVVSEGGEAKLNAPDKAGTAADELPKGLEVHPVSDQLKQLEARMTPLFKQPLEKQPLDQMIAAYQAIDKQALPAADQRIVLMRLATLRRNQQIARTLKEIEKVQKSSTVTASAKTANVQSEAHPAAPAHGLPGAPIHYNAVGRLMASSVYDGQNLPRMFRVIDPASGRTLAWVAPGDKVSARYLGKLVGVIGTKDYDPALKFNVLNVKQLDLLEPVQPDKPLAQEPLANSRQPPR